MYRRILVPLDGSDHAACILPRIEPLAQKSGSELLLLQVIDVNPVIPAENPLADVSAAAVLEELREKADADLDRLVAQLAGRGIPAVALVEIGTAAAKILEAAQTREPTLVAMTTHGRTGIARWVFGSVAEKVLRASDTPVLLCRTFRRRDGAYETVGDAPLDFRRILVPVDGSDLALAVVPHVAELARNFDAQVVLFHACWQTDDKGWRHMDGMAQAFAQEGITVTRVLKDGDPAQQILDYAEQHHVDLVAMTTHGRSGVSRWVFGSVTERVLRAAGNVMLVVRNTKSTLLRPVEPAGTSEFSPIR